MTIAETIPARDEAIEASLRWLFPPGVAVAALRIGAPVPPLWPSETARVVRAVPGRRAEFAAGRAAARRALAALGHPAVAIPSGPDRAPRWPDGIGGSIAHGAGVAAAAVRLGGPLGLDVEEDAPIEPDLWAAICSADELSALPETDRGRLVRHVFAAKEAVYKAQYPLSRRLIDFHALSVRLSPGAFTARLRDTVGPLPAGLTFAGRLARTAGVILAGVAT